MKKKMLSAMLALGAVTMLSGISVYAEITEDTVKDYMGTWYVNYVEEDGIRMNIPGLMEMVMTVTLNEDGSIVTETKTLAGDDDESQMSEANWKLADSKIRTDINGSDFSIDEIDGEVIGIEKTGDSETIYVFGRELIQEETDWEKLLEEQEASEREEAAATPAVNPYVYDSGTKNGAEIIKQYLNLYYYEEMDVTLDEANGTFTADSQANESSEAMHIEGTFEITADGYLNAAWKDVQTDMDRSYDGKTYADCWDSYCLKEDNSNLEDLLLALANSVTYRNYTKEQIVEIKETSDTEGTIHLKNEEYDWENTCEYTIIKGVNPCVTISSYDPETDYTSTNDNYKLQKYMNIN